MIVRLTEDKIRKIKEVLLSVVHNSHSVKIRDIARIIGYPISSFPGMKFGALYYRYLEMDKIKNAELIDFFMDMVHLFNVINIHSLLYCLCQYID